MNLGRLGSRGLRQRALDSSAMVLPRRSNPEGVSSRGRPTNEEDRGLPLPLLSSRLVSGCHEFRVRNSWHLDFSEYSDPAWRDGPVFRGGSTSRAVLVQRIPGAVETGQAPRRMDAES